MKCPKCYTECEKRPTKEDPEVWWCHYCCVTYPYKIVVHDLTSIDYSKVVRYPGLKR